MLLVSLRRDLEEAEVGAPAASGARRERRGRDASAFGSARPQRRPRARPARPRRAPGEALVADVQVGVRLRASGQAARVGAGQRWQTLVSAVSGARSGPRGAQSSPRGGAPPSPSCSPPAARSQARRPWSRSATWSSRLRGANIQRSARAARQLRGAPLLLAAAWVRTQLLRLRVAAAHLALAHRLGGGRHAAHGQRRAGRRRRHGKASATEVRPARGPPALLLRCHVASCPRAPPLNYPFAFSALNKRLAGQGIHVAPVHSACSCHPRRCVRVAAAERSMARRLSRPTACEVAAPDSGRGGLTGSAPLSLSLSSGSTRRRQPGPVMTLAAREAELPSVSPVRLLFRRPLALLSLMPVELSTFIAGGVAGAIAKTTTAPLDRVRAAAAAPAAAPSGPRAARLPLAPAGQDPAAGLLRERAVRCRKGGRQGRPGLHVHGDRQDGGHPRLLARKHPAGEARRDLPMRCRPSALTSRACCRQVLRVLPYSACQLYRRVCCAPRCAAAWARN